MSRPARRAPRRPRGFTLIELMVAGMIAALIIGAAWSITGQVASARQRLDLRSAHFAAADAALHAVESALRQTFRNPNPEASPAITFVGLDDVYDGRPADRLRFWRVSDERVRDGYPESDVHEVEFYLEPIDDESPYPALLRRTDPTRNELPDEGGVVELIAENVIAMDLTYFDGEVWTDDWPDYLETWPQIVRLRLSVAFDLEVDPDLPAAARPYSRLIYLPWMPTPASEADTAGTSTDGSDSANPRTGADRDADSGSGATGGFGGGGGR